MTESRKSALITWTTGDLTGPPVLLLHDRYLDQDSMADLAAALAPTHRVLSLRSARTQMEKSLIKGYYWFLGPFDRPELSTFGDGLHHLERLLLTVNEETGRRVALVGRGEGGVMALMLALVWRELVSGVVSIDGPLPLNIDQLPLDIGPAEALPALLVEETRDLAGTAGSLAERGAIMQRAALDAAATPAFVARWTAALT